MANNINYYWVCIIYAPMGRTLHIYSPEFPDVKYRLNDIYSFDHVTEGTIHNYKNYLYNQIEKQGYIPRATNAVNEALTYGIAEFSKETLFPVNKIFHDEIITMRNIKLITNSIIPYEDDNKENITKHEKEYSYSNYMNNDNVIEKIKYFDKDDICQISTILFATIFEWVTTKILATDSFKIKNIDDMKKDAYKFFHNEIYPCSMNIKEQEIFFGKVLVQLRTMLAIIEIGSIKDLMISNDLVHDLLKTTVDKIDMYTPKFNQVIEPDCKMEDLYLDKRICNRVAEIFAYIIPEEFKYINDVLYRVK